MKNKKGFTLIELLAVIVILAIIALIATPIILNMIENAKKGAAKDSAYGYIEAIEYNNSIADLGLNNNYTKIPDGEDLDVTGLEVKIKGTKPESGTITIKEGLVKEAELCINNYKVKYNGQEAEIDGKCNGTIEYKKYENGTAIYYNPVEGKICTDYKEENSKTGTKTGCMKFYTFNDDKTSSTVNMILDHNTTALTEWVSLDDYIEVGGTAEEYGENGNNNKGPLTVTKRLNEDTKEWKNKARLITADEVAKITGNTEFKTETTTTSGWYYFETNTITQPSPYTKTYAWLYDNTYKCTNYGCNVSDDNKYENATKESTNYVYGYWTSSAINGTSNNAWRVFRYGSFTSSSNDLDDYYGVRPVITVTKKQIEDGMNVYKEYVNDTLEIIKNKISATTTEGVYYFDNDVNLDYGDNKTKIELSSINKEIRGNVNIWNNQIIYACLKYGIYNFEYDTTNKIIERNIPCSINRYDNLVVNGDLRYKSNYNLTKFGTYNNEGFLTLNTDKTISATIDDVVSIDYNKKYQLGIDMKASNNLSKYYIGFLLYDVDKKRIEPYNVMYISDTLTTLAKDLKKGDTVVYLKDLTNWNIETETRHYQRGFIFWNYQDSTGYKYPELTYSRNVVKNVYVDSNVDKNTNTIKLNSAWTGNTIPAGTKVSQSNSGSWENNSVLAYQPVTTTWGTYNSKTVSGLNNTGNTAIYDKFWHGTKFIKFYIYYNYNQIANTTTDIKNIYIKEVNE